jgi:hypothetical protein
MDPSNRKPFNPRSRASHTNQPFATQKSVKDATEKEPEDNRLDCELATGPPMGKKARALLYTNGTMPARNGKGDKSFKHNEVHIPSVDEVAFERRVNNDALIFDVGLLRLFAHTAEREEVQAFLNELLQICKSHGGRFKGHKLLCIESSSDEVGALLGSYPFLDRIVKFLAKHGCGYHRIHIGLPDEPEVREFSMDRLISLLLEFLHPLHFDGAHKAREWARAVWNGPGSKDPAIALGECMAVLHTCGGGGWGGPAELLGCSSLPELIPKSRSVPLEPRLKHGVCLATQGADETPEGCWARVLQQMGGYTISIITDMPIEKMHAMSKEIAALPLPPWDDTHPLMVSWILVQLLPDFAHARIDPSAFFLSLHFFDPQGLWCHGGSDARHV